MPTLTIVFASPKGGAGKSTSAVVLATEAGRAGASVVAIDYIIEIGRRLIDAKALTGHGAVAL